MNEIINISSINFTLFPNYVYHNVTIMRKFNDKIINKNDTITYFLRLINRDIFHEN